MDESFNFKNLIIPTAILLDSQLLMGQQGQPPLVEATEADAKYTNTTVVYKQKAADDALVLLSLGQAYGTGSVVRIAVADPKPQPVEVKAPTRGETAPALVAEQPAASPAPVLVEKLADHSTEVVVKRRPETSKATEKALAEQRSQGLHSPKPIPVRSTGKVYDPHKKSLLDRLPKLHLPQVGGGGRVRCPKV